MNKRDLEKIKKFTNAMKPSLMKLSRSLSKAGTKTEVKQ